MRQIANKVRQWLRYQLGQRDLELHVQQLKNALELNFQDIKRDMAAQAAQSAAQSADHVQILSTLGLLIADQKAMLQLMKERKVRRDPLSDPRDNGNEPTDTLELGLQEIRRDIAAQSADHLQTLSAFGLLIADQKAMLQLMKEREPQRDPLITLEARLSELQAVIEKQSADHIHTLSAMGLLIADQKALLEAAKDVTVGQGQMKQASHLETLKDDYA